MLQFSVALMFYGRASRAASMLVEEQLGNIPVAPKLATVNNKSHYCAVQIFSGL